jgi:fatty aldehyde-generating acyl-ACP reductase
VVNSASFAFIIHPLNPKRDVARKFPLLGRYLPESLIHFLSAYFPPVYISEVTGIQSQATGQSADGWLIACPYTPQRMLTLPVEQVYAKIVQTGRLAEKLGAKILGLGAFTSVVGDGGLTIADRLNIPVTTGDSYTVWVAVQAILQAAHQIGMQPQHATAAVVGATGAIGRICAHLLAKQVKVLQLFGLDEARLQVLATEITALVPCTVQVHTNLTALVQADLVVAATSSVDAIIHPEHLKHLAVVCDVSRPRDVSAQVATARPDVLVIDGGTVTVPGAVNFHFNFGLPEGLAYACMAETIALALEGRFESYTLGKNLTLQQVEQIGEITTRHGFQLSGFRSFEANLSPTRIAELRSLRFVN